MQVLPHASTWPQALAALVHPTAAVGPVSLLSETADALCARVEAVTRGADLGTTARAIRRATVTAVFGAAELYATQAAARSSSSHAHDGDNDGEDAEVSAAHSAVAAFVDRRVAQVDVARAVLPAQLPSLVDGAAAVFRNVVGLPQRRT